MSEKKDCMVEIEMRESDWKRVSKVLGLYTLLCWKLKKEDEEERERYAAINQFIHRRIQEEYLGSTALKITNYPANRQPKQVADSSQSSSDRMVEIKMRESDWRRISNTISLYTLLCWELKVDEKERERYTAINQFIHQRIWEETPIEEILEREKDSKENSKPIPITEGELPF